LFVHTHLSFLLAPVMTKLIGLLLKVNYFMGLDVGLSGFGCSLTHPVKVNDANGPIFQSTIALNFQGVWTNFNFMLSTRSIKHFGHIKIIGLESRWGLFLDVHLMGKSCRNC